MSIIIELNEGIIKRTTTAGKEQSGNIAFMGGSFYIPQLDHKYKDGNHTNIRMEGAYNAKYGLNAVSVIDAKPISK